MLSKEEWGRARKWVWKFVSEAGIPLQEEEFDRIEVTDLDLNELELTGLQILTLADTEWLGAKLLILQPDQFFPQHRHPPSPKDRYPGKTELLRGQYGCGYAYVSGKPTPHPAVRPPLHRMKYCTVRYEVRLLPGDQLICPPNTWHWFQAGPEGAILWSLSSRVTDAEDQFLDPEVIRQTKTGATWNDCDGRRSYEGS